MTSKNELGRAAFARLALLALVVCLLAMGLIPRLQGGLGLIVTQTLTAFCSPEVQWMVFLCGAVYFAAFGLLQHRESGEGFWRLCDASAWLTLALLFSSLQYFLSYSATSSSALPLKFLAGAVLGKGASLWAARFPAASDRQEASAAGVVLNALAGSLVAACLWQPNMGRASEYRGQARWSGAWDNPNTYGLLMGMGAVLALGRAVRQWKSADGRGQRAKLEKRLEWWSGGVMLLALMFYGVAAAVMGLGLVKSYSRGAWVGTAAGLALLIIRGLGLRGERRTSSAELPSLNEGTQAWLGRTWLPLAVILVSASVLVFWNLRGMESAVARRAVSVGNANDFSWRNRTAAWEGGLRMMAEKPWLGFGWNQPEPVYNQFYRESKVAEGAAIQTNDYLTLGATLGVPALFCFGMYIWLALTGKAESGKHGDGVGEGDVPGGGGCAARGVLVRWGAVQAGDGGGVLGVDRAGKKRGLTTKDTKNTKGAGGKAFVPVLVTLLFVGAMFWARGRDPFERRLFKVRSAECVAVLPKTAPRPLAVVVYLHGAGGSVLESGNELRQMAEMGLAAVALGYDQTNETACDGQFAVLLDYLRRQKWADTNRMAWVGLSLGAQRTLAFALKHPDSQPQLLVRLAGGWAEGAEKIKAGRRETESGKSDSALRTPHSARGRMSGLLIHGENDEIFPLADARRVADCLRTNSVPVELRVMAGQSHAFGPNRLLLFRAVGEYCLAHLNGPEALSQYRSISEWQAQAKPLWLFWLPAFGWLCFSGVTRWQAHIRARDGKREPLTLAEKALRWVAVVLALAALGETALHLISPRLTVSERMLTLARDHLIQPKEESDFDFLAARPIWQGKPLKALLEHVELAGYNRELINWKLDEQSYRDFVLFPEIDPALDGRMDWRRALWESFYPRIRKEQGPEEAADIVVRYLRERVTVEKAESGKQKAETGRQKAEGGKRAEIGEIWRRQITDERGFEAVYVAALRSVGVPSRLDAEQRAEFWTGAAWRTAPQPVFMIWD